MKRRGSTKASPPAKVARLSDEETSEYKEEDYEGSLVPDIDKGLPTEFDEITLSLPQWDYEEIDVKVDEISKTNADATIKHKQPKTISFIGHIIGTKKKTSLLDEVEYYEKAMWGKKEIGLSQTIMYLEHSQQSQVYHIGQVVEIYKEGSGAFVTVHPFYRHADIVKSMNNIMTYDDKEVYLEHNVKLKRYKVIVDMQNIEELCQVLYLNDVERFKPFRGQRGIFFCRYTYDSISKMLRNIHRDYLYDTATNWRRTYSFLRNQLYQIPPDRAPVVLDAFCGTGGLSLGFHQRGCHIAYAVDIHDAAARTFKKNFPACNVFNLDVEQFLRMLKVVDHLRRTYVSRIKTEEPKEIVTKIRTHKTIPHRFQFYVAQGRWCNDEDFADLGDVGHYVKKAFNTTQPDPYLGQAIHPFAQRPLTVRERARLQGFPDSFEFVDTIKDAQRHVGNAVPVFVANAIAFEFGKAWTKALRTERPPEGTQATLEGLIGIEQMTQDMVFYTQGSAIEKLIADGWKPEHQVNETAECKRHLKALRTKVPENLMQNEISETDDTKSNRKEVTDYIDNKVKKSPKTPSPEKGPKQQPITGFFNVVEKAPEPKPVKKSTLTIKKRGSSAGKT